MLSRRLPPIAIVGTLFIAGCNSAQAPQTPAAPPPDAPLASRGGVALPEGSGCETVIARYRAVIDNDRAMGHINPSVYDQIQGELGAAQSACASGQDARALALARASKARHGYPG
jgi:hypothetical protein